jgi:hypothetical protein
MTTDPTAPARPDANLRVLDWPAALIYQLDWHWTNQLRPRLNGLTDEEYRWEPTPGAWNVLPRGEQRTATAGGSGDFVVEFDFPEPEPAPLTTIAWRLAHLVVGVLGARVSSHFDGPPVDYQGFAYAGTAAEALAQLDDAYAGWVAGVRTWDAAALAEPCGPAEGPWADHSRADLVLHINREVIHHGAEIALLRDLWAHRAD